MAIQKVEVLRNTDLQVTTIQADGVVDVATMSGKLQRDQNTLRLDWSAPVQVGDKTTVTVFSQWAPILKAQCDLNGKSMCAQEAQDSTQVRYSATDTEGTVTLRVVLNPYNLLLWPQPTMTQAQVAAAQTRQVARTAGNGLVILFGFVIIGVMVAVVLKKLRRVKPVKK